MPFPGLPTHRARQRPPDRSRAWNRDARRRLYAGRLHCGVGKRRDGAIGSIRCARRGLRGRRGRARPRRHAGFRRRARRGASRDDRDSHDGGGDRQHDDPSSRAPRHASAGRRPRRRGLSQASRARHGQRACAADGGSHERARGQGDRRIRPAAGSRRGRLRRRRPFAAQRAHDATRAVLCARLRRADRALRRKSAISPRA